MAFSDFSFLFLLFPLALVLILPAPGFLRQPVLLAVSLLFFAWGSPEYVFLLILLYGNGNRYLTVFIRRNKYGAVFILHQLCKLGIRIFSSDFKNIRSAVMVYQINL